MNHPQAVTLLIVDDEELLRDSMALDFKRKGFNVLQAENGKIALTLVKAHKVDLVITDVRMPGGGGLDLLKSIQTLPTPWPAMILLSGFTEVLDPSLSSLPTFKMLPKPFNRAELSDLVYELTECKPRLKSAA